jgi:toxin-antitoxin system PIN domain toxin
VILIDVNVLLYAHREDAERHREYRDWLVGVLSGVEKCGISDLVLSGCLRLLTHPKIFHPPTPLPLALSFVQNFRDHANVVVLAPGDRHWQIFTRLIHQVAAKGNLIPDAYHAALAMEHGCEWVTTDRGYGRFPGLRCRHPLDHR